MEVCVLLGLVAIGLLLEKVLIWRFSFQLLTLILIFTSFLAHSYLLPPLHPSTQQNRPCNFQEATAASSFQPPSKSFPSPF